MIKHYYQTTEPICHYDTTTPVEIPDTYQQRPIRGLWVSNVVNIDLPVITEDGSQYKSLIEEMITTCQAYQINTIYFQVRTTNDAFYQSKLNPYSRYLTGKEGTKPPFDVFGWIIEQMHAANIEVHAWCNPYRISADGTRSMEEYLATCDELNFAKRYPDTIVLDEKGKLILNPADPRVKDHIIASMVELCEDYDIDGIHFDDYFYPYSPLSEERNDLGFFEQRPDKEESLGDFRRRQVNDIIQGVHQAIKNVDESLVFSVSPFGIWKNKASDPLGSNTAPACGQSYYMQFADTVTWIKNEYVDVIVPQIYFPFGHKIARFADICDFWVETVRGTNVKLLIGHGAYRSGREDEWLNPDELVEQLRYSGQYDEVIGHVFFTYHDFLLNDNTQEGILRLKQLLNEVTT